MCRKAYREFMRMSEWYSQTQHLREDNRMNDGIAEILPSNLRQRSPKKADSKMSNVVISRVYRTFPRKALKK